ncbi:uncharacterized protein LOC111366707 [Olea europaea var. sylvestris]|uniref:uncharacterized protein LOC111366707 n=1 Tax=Olea europaea var. sylvestris TaxID=158386 RepID=UPI000C1D501D|nr:uncharacterized protein LOC111366707 [Olea europaea var. sylvestris]
MEVFSDLMGLMVAKQDFKYHWSCEEEKITHLCFADDLMVFCRVDVGSESFINAWFNRFKALFGLIPNPEKINLFVSGVSSYLKDHLLDVLGYKEGVLPVYWSSIFILPKAVIKQVEATLRTFLWKGCDLNTDGTKVVWTKICMPKDDGGLGLRSMEIWNKAVMLKHLWSLCMNSASSCGFHGHDAT